MSTQVFVTVRWSHSSQIAVCWCTNSVGAQKYTLKWNLPGLITCNAQVVVAEGVGAVVEAGVPPTSSNNYRQEASMRYAQTFLDIIAQV